MVELSFVILFSFIVIWVCWRIGEHVNDKIMIKDAAEREKKENIEAEEFVKSVIKFVDGLNSNKVIDAINRDYIIRAIIYREGRKDLIDKYIDILDKINE